MLETFTVETFEVLLGQPFHLTVAAPDGTAAVVPLRLERAERAAAPPGDRGRPPFSLTFAGPADRRLLQGTYPLRHATLGAFDLFIVPIAAEAEVVRYEAVFT